MTEYLKIGLIKYKILFQIGINIPRWLEAFTLPLFNLKEQIARGGTARTLHFDVSENGHIRNNEHIIDAGTLYIPKKYYTG